jgi:AraC-like DNA-binding protein
MRERRSTNMNVPSVALSAGGNGGNVDACVANATNATASATRKAVRQPQCSPIQAPIGAAQTVATETPVSTTAIARGMSRGGTRRIASAAAMDQKPPRATPSSTRAASSVGRLEAVAAIAFERMRIMVRPSSTQRRSRFDAPTTTAGPAMAPTTARYVLRVRMHQARLWLQRDHMRISVAAERLNYESEAAFSRAFKRLFGAPPSHFRQETER